MAFIYFAIKDGQPVTHTDIGEMENQGLKIIREMTVNEFLGYSNLVRVVDGTLFFGKTEKEEADGTARTRITEIDAALTAVNQKQIRPAAEIAHALGNKNTVPVEAVQKINSLEDEASALRLERARLAESLDAA
jgi:hypothetical protein